MGSWGADTWHEAMSRYDRRGAEREGEAGEAEWE